MCTYKCPVCQCKHSLEVVIKTQAKLIQDNDENLETDIDQASNRDHEWDDNSMMVCGCGYNDKAEKFKEKKAV